MKVYLATQLLALCSVTAAFTVPQNQLMPSVVLKARDRGDSQQGELAKAEGRARTRDRGPTTTLDRMVPGGALDRARPGRGMRQRLPVLQNPRHDRAWDDYQTPVTVQGQSLRTWAFESDRVDSVRVFMATDGRPMNANVELWQGPDNTPQKMGIYLEDGSVRPFNAVIYTPRDSNAVAIYNTATLEYPLVAGVEVESYDRQESGSEIGVLAERFSNPERARTVQGGAVYTEPFDAAVEGVTVFLTTEGRPLNARIELLQGPNNLKQCMEIYTEDGHERPLFVALDTPGSGNVIRIVNTASMEFPLYASIEPFLIDETFRSSFQPSRNMPYP